MRTPATPKKLSPLALCQQRGEKFEAIKAVLHKAACDFAANKEKSRRGEGLYKAALAFEDAYRLYFIAYREWEFSEGKA